MCNLILVVGIFVVGTERDVVYCNSCSVLEDLVDWKISGRSCRDYINTIVSELCSW